MKHKAVSAVAIDHIGKDKYYVVHPSLQSADTRRLNRKLGLHKVNKQGNSKNFKR